MAAVYEGQFKAIYTQAVELAYYSKGSMQLDSVMHKTPGEKSMIAEFYNKRLVEESKAARK